mgnify:CR=1 FL=1
MTITDNSSDHMNNCIKPPEMDYYWTYPTVSYCSSIMEDKTKKAIDILDMLRKEKKIKVESIDSFLELVDKISKLL